MLLTAQCTCSVSTVQRSPKFVFTSADFMDVDDETRGEVNIDIQVDRKFERRAGRRSAFAELSREVKSGQRCKTCRTSWWWIGKCVPSCYLRRRLLVACRFRTGWRWLSLIRSLPQACTCR
ncbi:hypothetical protein BaRGS_00011193, partial [Batillaria attramentaria]